MGRGSSLGGKVSDYRTKGKGSKKWGKNQVPKKKGDKKKRTKVTHDNPSTG